MLVVGHSVVMFCAGGSQAEASRRGHYALVSDSLARPRSQGISHLGLTVSDLDRSLAFYRDVLGAVVLRAPGDGDNPSFSGRMALVMIGSLGVDLFEHAASSGGRFNPAQTGLDHFALIASSVDDLEAWARWLDKHGVVCSPIRDSSGVGAQFDFADPDGIQIEFSFLDQEKLRASGMLSVSDGA